MLATILAAITAFLKALPLISSWFKTTEAQTQTETAKQEQTEAELLAKSGRPKW